MSKKTLEKLGNKKVLFVGDMREGTLDVLKKYNQETGSSLKAVVIVNQSKQKKVKKVKEKQKGKNFEIIECNYRSRIRIKKALEPFKEDIVAATSQFEDGIPELRKIIPHLPYLRSPTTESLEWATDKVLMRRMMDAHDKKLTPKFIVAKEASLDVIERTNKRLGYPVIVKPAGLGGSRLVSVCFHEDELQHVLKKAFRKLQKAYRDQNGRGEPQIIIEQALEGIMYSIDGYVNRLGKITLCPPVHIKTGKEIGFDDFFGYSQLTPTQLSKESVEGANAATIETVKAVGLRSTTFHCELFKTEKGWKIIEIGPRMGGFRHKLYELTYGINHIMNDILIKSGKPPVVPRKRKGYAVALKFFAREEGILTKISGLNKIKKLESYNDMLVEKKVGDELFYAKNNGDCAVKLFMFNQSRSGLLADIRRAEQALVLTTEPTRVFRKQLEQTADAILQPIEEVELKGKKVAKKVKEIIEDTFDSDSKK